MHFVGTFIFFGNYLCLPGTVCGSGFWFLWVLVLGSWVVLAFVVLGH